MGSRCLGQQILNGLGRCLIVEVLSAVSVERMSTLHESLSCQYIQIMPVPKHILSRAFAQVLQMAERLGCIGRVQSRELRTRGTRLHDVFAKGKPLTVPLCAKMLKLTALYNVSVYGTQQLNFIAVLPFLRCITAHVQGMCSWSNTNDGKTHLLQCVSETF